MRRVIGALCAIMISAGAALAAQAEGEIRKVDRDAMTVTLDDGKSYKLPGEFDISAIQEA